MDKLINEVNKLDLINGHIAWLFPLLTVSENTIRNVEEFIFFLLSKVYFKNFYTDTTVDISAWNSK